jgi:hypothetical protein
LQRLGILYTVYSAISWEKITLENLAFLWNSIFHSRDLLYTVKNMSHAILAVANKICVDVELVTCRLVYNHGVFVLSLIWPHAHFACFVRFLLLLLLFPETDLQHCFRICAMILLEADLDICLGEEGHLANLPIFP